MTANQISEAGEMPDEPETVTCEGCGNHVPLAEAKRWQDDVYTCPKCSPPKAQIAVAGEPATKWEKEIAAGSGAGEMPDQGTSEKYTHCECGMPYGGIRYHTTNGGKPICSACYKSVGESAEISHLRAQLAEAKAECEWMNEEASEDGNSWGTQCGHVFYLEDGDPESNCMKFCPFCGGSLRRVFHKDQEDDQ